MRHFKDFIFDEADTIPEVISKKGIETIRYLNIPNSFDTETTSFYEGNTKRATMYIWMLSINGQVVYGRTWAEFRFFLESLRRLFKLNYYRRMIVYVHNLGYDFQFMINQVQISEVFARKKRHPMKCLVNDCFEFRCSYILSGLSLEKTAENLTSIKINKKVGYLDYTLCRHYKTYLPPKELEYCEYDCLVLHYFIKEEMAKNGGDITKIPLTKTGYVRSFCRKWIKQHDNYYYYRDRIKKEAPTDENLFILLNKAFAGGYVHANCMYIFDLLDDIHSIDFTSSYPTQMIRHKFPRGKFIKRDITSKEKFIRYVNTYACVFKIKLFNVESITSHHIWSSSKCEYGTNGKYHAKIDNGRIMKSDEICTFMTDVDFKTFSKFYTFDDYTIEEFYCTTYDYLPKSLIECILYFYEQKTILKGVAGKEEEYLVFKGMLNAIYGMCVTNPVNDEILFEENTWDTSRPFIQQALEKTYNSNNTFICYQWGVWVTAWARYELLSGVLEIDTDVVYCDTDSIKFRKYEKYAKYIETYNANVVKDLENTLRKLNIPLSKLHPKDINGEEHMLGVWEYEGKYEKFKTLGAKRYMYVKKNKNGKAHLRFTISGLSNKYIYEDEIRPGHPEDLELREWSKKASPTQYILDHGGFDYFNDEMTIPKEWSARLTHSYSKEDDGYFCCNLEDYNGDITTVEEYNYIHLEKAPFTLSLSDDFANFLQGIEDGYICVRREKRPELAINGFEMELNA